jgi:hypothetical protein
LFESVQPEVSGDSVSLLVHPFESDPAPTNVDAIIEVMLFLGIFMARGRINFCFKAPVVIVIVCLLWIPYLIILYTVNIRFGS